jgi:hypothetical protein
MINPLSVTAGLPSRLGIAAILVLAIWLGVWWAA